MKRIVALSAVALLALGSFVWVTDAAARAGGGSSGGSRGSRSYSAPAPTSPSRVAPSRPVAPPPPVAPPAPQPSRWGGMGGMLGGLLVGGLLGSLLFGGGLGGHGLFGGIGLLEILVIGGLAMLAFSWMRRRQMESPGTPSYAGGYGYGNTSSSVPPLGGGTASSTPPERSSATALEEPPASSDLDRGLGHIRQMDPGFDPVAFADAASDLFFKIQAAWTTRDVSGVADLLTPEMRSLLQSQCDRLRAEHKINRLENIAVRRAEVTEAWEERGQDYATVYFLATVLDYTTDESGTEVLEGNRTEPVKFEEYWTFVRPVGPNRWRLSAIQQSS